MQTGIINELPISEILLLNQLYAAQESYNDYGKVIYSGLLNHQLSENYKTVSTTVRYLASSMTDLSLKEDKLIEGYEYTSTTLQSLISE